MPIISDEVSCLCDALKDALPLISRAATEEARRNAAPNGQPKQTERRVQLERAQALLSAFKKP